MELGGGATPHPGGWSGVGAVEGGMEGMEYVERSGAEGGVEWVGWCGLIGAERRVEWDGGRHGWSGVGGVE